jgi:hypothetical protein
MEVQEIRNLEVSKDNLQDILNQVNEIILTEETQREEADTALDRRITAEETRREEADTKETERAQTTEKGLEEYMAVSVADLYTNIGRESERAQTNESQLQAAVESERDLRIDMVNAETERAQETEDALGCKMQESDTKIAELQAFHIWDNTKLYLPFNPVFYFGSPYYANPANMPLAGQSPAEYPAKWIASGGGGGTVTVDGIHANTQGNIRLKYFVTKEEYRELKVKDRLSPGARYIITDKWQMPSIRDFSWMFASICAILNVLPKKTVDGVKQDSRHDIRLKRIVTGAEYNYLQRNNKLVPGARYIVHDRFRLPSVSDFGWMFTNICALLAIVPRKLSKVYHDGSLEGDGKSPSDPLQIANNAVTADKIDDKAVTTAKLDDGAVTEGKLDSDAVTTEKIADGAVTENKIEDGVITNAKLAAGAVAVDTTLTGDGTADEPLGVADGAVTAQKLADGAVTAAKLAETVNAELEGMENDIANIAQNPILGLIDADNPPGDGDYKIHVEGGVITLAAL